ncbi:hypothetical protein SH203_01846 [Brevundimonas sp. SH203]|uniref:BrnA antitoxin family protein n=1 Tax=Brevundimonas sp. SH203 TaxID=345167 RepID=UPI0009D0B5E4|nr:BrnA antitoxin family protein [Brevundimonas sp. SH203]GAW41440.1 hypothetical protein SH203_01846 [Brevundimonas sp. SH203]
MTNSAAVDPLDDDNPELTDADIARMRPAHEVLSPAAYARLTGEQDVALKLSAETIKAFAEEGEDWRERMAQALTDVARNKRAA